MTVLLGHARPLGLARAATSVALDPPAGAAITDERRRSSPAQPMTATAADRPCGSCRSVAFAGDVGSRADQVGLCERSLDWVDPGPARNSCAARTMSLLICSSETVQFSSQSAPAIAPSTIARSCSG